MVDYRTGNLFAIDADALVNTVNCVGVMGRGVALQFKEIFPANFKAYAAACERSEVQPGRMFVFETGTMTNPKFIINFPTKRHWRGKSRIEDIESGLKALAHEIGARKIRSIALPPLGAGLGGLEWTEVRKRIEVELGRLSGVEIIVFEPHAGSVAITPSTAVPEMTSGRAALVELINRYLGGLLDPFVTLLEVHKLMYFMQEAGQRLRLSYSKAHYGPYAENLRHVLRAVEGHLISGYADGGDAPDKQLKLVPGAVEEAGAFLANDSETRARFARVGDLVSGYETPFGLELLATVHWVATREGARSPQEAVARVHAWSDYKRRFTDRQVGLAFVALKDKGWLKA
ncbi:MAG: macro domain-containing protein [Alphaproteobacteria bacterium]|nr:macro domain-containing protein [Alphaproteobacteria bacterium]